VRGGDSIVAAGAVPLLAAAFAAHGGEARAKAHAALVKEWEMYVDSASSVCKFLLAKARLEVDGPGSLFDSVLSGGVGADMSGFVQSRVRARGASSASAGGGSADGDDPLYPSALTI
jgi:hypothetical protein